MKLRYHYALSKDSYTVRHTWGPQARYLNFHVDSVGYYHAYEGYYIDREGLDSYLLLYTLSGKGYLEYQGQQYFLSAGTIAIIQCSEHQFYRTEGDEWEFHFIHFYGSSAVKYFPMLTEEGAAFVEITNTVKMNELMKELYSQTGANGGIADIQIANIMENIYTELLIEHLSPQKDKSHILHRESITGVMQYIQEHYSEEITVEKMAEQAAMSKYYFIRVFKKAAGVSPHEYLKCCRINESKKLLRETEYSVSQIADLTGYGNVNVYIQNFKQCVGITPLKYRKDAF